jgi:hypothetical protein
MCDNSKQPIPLNEQEYWKNLIRISAENQKSIYTNRPIVLIAIERDYIHFRFKGMPIPAVYRASKDFLIKTSKTIRK